MMTTYQLDCNHTKYLPSTLNSYITRLECEHAQSLQYIPNYPNITMINCSYCSELKETPYIPTLESLHAVGCLKLHTVQFAPEYTSLENCKNLHQINDVSKTISLNIAGCTSLDSAPLAPKLKNLIISKCSFTTIPSYGSLQVLDALNCRYIRTVPQIDTLVSLYLTGSKITSLPMLPLLKTLNCSYNINLDTIPEYPRLEYLICINLLKLTNIPQINTLIALDCSSCHMLQSIPMIDTLVDIICTKCPEIRSIPHMRDLKSLNCGNCRNLISLPHVDNISCSGCRMITTEFPANTKLTSFFCPWISKQTQISPNFQNNIKKLTILQQWFRRTLHRRQLISIAKQIIPIWYAPDAPGGIHAKRQLNMFINTMTA